MLDERLPPSCLRLDQLRWRLSALALQGVTGLCDGHMTSDQSFLNARQALSLLGHTTPDLGKRNDNAQIMYFVFRIIVFKLPRFGGTGTFPDPI